MSRRSDPEPATMVTVVDPEQLARAHGLIRSYGAVAIIGAGLSASRYPMTAELPSLLWHALDAHPPERSSLARNLGREDRPAKELIGTDSVALDAAWRTVEQVV